MSETKTYVEVNDFVTKLLEIEDKDFNFNNVVAALINSTTTNLCHCSSCDHVND